MSGSCTSQVVRFDEAIAVGAELDEDSDGDVAPASLLWDGYGGVDTTSVIRQVEHARMLLSVDATSGMDTKISANARNMSDTIAEELMRQIRSAPAILSFVPGTLPDDDDEDDSGGGGGGDGGEDGDVDEENQDEGGDGEGSDNHASAAADAAAAATATATTPAATTEDEAAAAAAVAAAEEEASNHLHDKKLADWMSNLAKSNSQQAAATEAETTASAASAAAVQQPKQKGQPETMNRKRSQGVESCSTNGLTSFTGSLTSRETVDVACGEKKESEEESGDDTDDSRKVNEVHEKPPCRHNQWDRVSKKKNSISLRCRACQAYWKTRLTFFQKCQRFYAGGCALGDSCPHPHIYSRAAEKFKERKAAAKVKRLAFLKHQSQPAGVAAAPAGVHANAAGVVGDGTDGVSMMLAASTALFPQQAQQQAQAQVQAQAQAQAQQVVQVMQMPMMPAAPRQQLVHPVQAVQHLTQVVPQVAQQLNFVGQPARLAYPQSAEQVVYRQAAAAQVAQNQLAPYGFYTTAAQAGMVPGASVPMPVPVPVPAAPEPVNTTVLQDLRMALIQIQELKAQLTNAQTPQ